MADSVTRLAYQTMQQGKSLLGIAHKQISTQLMELVAPKANAETVPITAETLQALRRSMDNLLERDFPVIGIRNINQTTGQLPLDFLVAARNSACQINLNLIIQR